MTVIEHIKGSKQRVKDILTRFSDTRDNDGHLLALIWYHKLGSSIINLSAKDFLKMVKEGKVTSPETIRRNRQLLQAKHPELRGTKVNQRLKEEKEVRNEINND